MAVIEVEHLTKTFGPKVAVSDLSFSVDEGEILVIVGASGCGKTTTLRSIAGLDRPTSGTIRVDGRVVVSDDAFVPPERRGIGMVFQTYALWPHMSVFANVAYALTIAKRPKEEIREAVREALALVGLSGMEERFPSTLSGGQQQRVALARCAVARPRVLLLDEPLSNLDAKLREQMRFELRRLIKALNSTAVHITHDQTEAMGLADRIIYMRDGAIEQIGTGRELYRTPRNKSVAEFIGIASFIPGVVAGRGDGDIVDVRIADGSVLRARATSSEARSGDVELCIRPEGVRLSDTAVDGENTLAGTITAEAFLGDHTEYLVACGETTLRVRAHKDHPVGSTVSVHLDPQQLLCLPGSDRARAAA